LAEKPEIAGGDLMATRRLLAAAERARKQKDLSRDELQTLWESQLSNSERASLEQLLKQPNITVEEKRRVRSFSI
jgi:hypothetical protein